MTQGTGERSGLHEYAHFIVRALSAARRHARRIKPSSTATCAALVENEEHTCAIRDAPMPREVPRGALSPYPAQERSAIALNAAIFCVDGGWVDQAFRAIEGVARDQSEWNVGLRD